MVPSSLTPSGACNVSATTSPASGIGRAIDYHPRSQAARRGGGEARRLHIGVVGLGAGALAASGQQGDRVRFYEIDPDVEVLA